MKQTFRSYYVTGGEPHNYEYCQTVFSSATNAPDWSVQLEVTWKKKKRGKNALSIWSSSRLLAIREAHLTFVSQEALIHKCIN